MLVVISALSVAVPGLLALLRRRSAIPSSVLSHSVFILGIALFLNLAFPWYRVGATVRAATVGLLGVGALSYALAAFKPAGRFRNLLPTQVSDWVYWTLGIAMLMISVMPAVAPGTAAVDLGLPFDEWDWLVAQGGRIPFINHHLAVPEQKWALDLVRIGSDGKSFQGPQAAIDSFLALGCRVLAPVDGVIVACADGFPDMQIGERDLVNVAGNHVVLETSCGIRVTMCHLRCGSIAVSEGQQVAAGDPVRLGTAATRPSHTSISRQQSGLQTAGGPESP